MATEEWIRKVTPGGISTSGSQYPLCNGTVVIKLHVIVQAISNGRLYEELPPRVRTLLPLSDWKTKCVTCARCCWQRTSKHMRSSYGSDGTAWAPTGRAACLRAVIRCADGRRVKGYCHQRGLRWGDSLAKTVCGEQEYYEDLIRFYRSSLRVRGGQMKHSNTCRTVQRPLFESCHCKVWFGACQHLRLCAQLFPYHLASYVCQVLRTTPFKYYCDLLFSVMREERSYDFIPNFTVGRPPPCMHHKSCVLVAHARLQGGCWLLRAKHGAHAGG